MVSTATYFRSGSYGTVSPLMVIMSFTEQISWFLLLFVAAPSFAFTTATEVQRVQSDEHDRLCFGQTLNLTKRIRSELVSLVRSCSLANSWNLITITTILIGSSYPSRLTSSLSLGSPSSSSQMDFLDDLSSFLTIVTPQLPSLFGPFTDTAGRSAFPFVFAPTVGVTTSSQTVKLKLPYSQLSI